MFSCEYIITTENRLSLCDEIAGMTESFCRKYLKERRDLLRYRLTVEECLLGYLTEDSIGRTLTFTAEKKRFRPPTITITCNGDACNPYETEEKGIGGEGSFNALRVLGLAPAYTYSRGINVLRFDLSVKSNSELKSFLLIFLLALLVGSLGSSFLPLSVRTLLSDAILTPVYEVFLNLLSLVAGPMIFLSVAWGIYNIGDTMSFNIIGKNVIFSFLRNDFLVCLLSLLTIPLFGLRFRTGELGPSQLAELVRMILGCVPKNIVVPFADGNTLQIIFMAVMVGSTLLFLGKKAATIARVIEEINLIMQHLMSFVGKIVPYLVFVVVVTLFWSGTFAPPLSAWRFFAVLLGGTVVFCAGFLLITVLRYKVNALRLVKKCLPSVMIAGFTACTSASFDSTMRICTDKLGIRKSLASFGVPLGMVVHNPIACFNYLIITLYCASVYGLECSLAWYVTSVFCCTVLAVATPPIPGGGIIVFTMLFLQLGIPVEAIALVSALNMLADFLTTAGDIFCLFPSLIRAADKGGMLDLECLQK